MSFRGGVNGGQGQTGPPSATANRESGRQRTTDWPTSWLRRFVVEPDRTGRCQPGIRQRGRRTLHGQPPPRRGHGPLALCLTNSSGVRRTSVTTPRCTWCRLLAASANEPNRRLDDVRSVSRVRASKGDDTQDHDTGHRYTDHDESRPRKRIRLISMALHNGLLQIMTELEARRTQLGRQRAYD